MRAEQPLLRLQFRRLTRLGWRFWVLAMLLWVFISWFLRYWLIQNVLLGTLGMLPGMLLGVLTFSVRIDVALAVLLQVFLWPREHWQEMRPQLRLTSISAGDITRARMLPSVATLAAINLLSIPLYFRSDWWSGYGIPEFQRVLINLAFVAGAWLEDVTYAAICVAVTAYCLSEPRVATSVAIGRALLTLFLCGLGVSVVANLYWALSAMVTVTVGAISPGTNTDTWPWFVLTAAISTAILILFETWLAAMLWRRLRRRYEAIWTAEEE